MELQERYIAAGLKHIPPTEKDGVEKAMRRIIAERLQERGNASEETEREVLRGLGSPRILAEKQLREPPHLIGPELYGTYFLIVKIVMIVAVIGMLVLQLLFSASKLVFRKWTYPVATASLILNVLSFVLLWFILQDTAILNPELVTKIGEATDGQRVLNTAFNSIKAVFLFIFLLDSFEGFHDAYKNSKKPA